MTFIEIQQDVYDRIGALQSPDPAVSRRVKRFVNRWNRKILTAKGMVKLRRVVITKASVADQALYAVSLKSIQFMSESTTQRRIYKKTLGWYRDRVPAPATMTGTPLDYVPMGNTRILARPANASEIFIKSTEAADVGTVRVEAILSNGYPVSLSKALTGTVAVSMSATITDVIDVVDVNLSAAQTGVVTVHEDSGAGLELTRLQIGQTVPRFLSFALVPTPSAAVTYTLDGEANVVDMVEDTDEPFPDPDFHDILVDGAVHDEWKSKGRSTDAQELRIEIEARIQQLRGALLEWPEADRTRYRSFEETIHLPVA